MWGTTSAWLCMMRLQPLMHAWQADSEVCRYALAPYLCRESCVHCSAVCYHNDPARSAWQAKYKVQPRRTAIPTPDVGAGVVGHSMEQHILQLGAHVQVSGAAGSCRLHPAQVIVPPASGPHAAHRHLVLRQGACTCTV